jgi:hypothetical protein
MSKFLLSLRWKLYDKSHLAVKVVSQNLAKTMVTIWIMATTKLDGILYFDLFSRDESVYIFSGNSTKYLKKMFQKV